MNSVGAVCQNYCISIMWKCCHFLHSARKHSVIIRSKHPNFYSWKTFWDGRALRRKGAFLHAWSDFRPLLIWGCRRNNSESCLRKTQYDDYEKAGWIKAAQKFLPLHRSNHHHLIINILRDRPENVGQNPDSFISQFFFHWQIMIEVSQACFSLF